MFTLFSGILERDILTTIEDESYDRSDDALKLWRTNKMPFKVTFQRPKISMPVLVVARAGLSEVCGKVPFLFISNYSQS